ncbi:MAG: hypothetical protein HYW48_04310 [Deltaproteobacteria bacterium]|nr:hypothetical protein [Deltaproteobacteria bacterium]
MKFLLAVLLFSLTGACATVFTGTQYISVDSHPRGLPVYGKDGELLEKTPFAVKLRRDWNLTLYTGPEHSKEHKVSCGISWLDSVLGNGFFAFFHPLFSVAGLGLDLLTGAGLECPSHVFLETEEKGEGEFCKRYLLLPPYHESLIVSETILSEGRRILETSASACDTLVSNEVADEVFSYFGVRNKTKRRHFPQDFLNLWAYETGANTLVDFEIHEGDEAYAVTIKVKDIYSGTEDEEVKFEVPRSSLPLGEKKGWFGFAFTDFLLNAIPNTVSAGQSLIPNRFEPLEDVVLEGKNARTVPFVELFSIRNPGSMEPWALDYNFGPSFQFFYEAHDFAVETDFGEDETLTWVLFRIFVNFQLEGIVHTPAGAFTLGIGGGPAYLYGKTTERLLQNRVTFLPAVTLGYRAFFSRNFFAFAETIFIFEENLEDDLLRLSGDHIRLSFGIGYFLPLRPQRYLLF